MIHKELLVPDRVRRPPREGWSWIDRRFLREHAARLSHEAITLYLFLAAVSDQQRAVVLQRHVHGDPLADERAGGGRRARRVGGGRPGGLPLAVDAGAFAAANDARPVAAAWRRWARCSAPWPIPRIPRGGSHEGLPVGRDSPLARGGAAVAGGDCSAFALPSPDRPQGAGDGVASHADTRAVRKRPRPLTGRRSTRCWASTPTSRRCGCGRRSPGEKTAIAGASTPCGGICTRSGPRGDGSIRR